MFETEDLEVWNLTPGIAALAGAQQVFNVVGRVKSPQSVSQLTYFLNDRPETPAFFNNTRERTGRLERPGDFNIDTIRIGDLQPQNRLVLRLYPESDSRRGASPREYSISFPTCLIQQGPPALKLNFAEIEAPEQAGQVVDGKWRLREDEHGRRCLEICTEDAGYDRIILFGRHDWTNHYEISARLRVTEWTHKVHNVGLLFKWNTHLVGDGRHLPTQWSTGLGYYDSRSLGLRLRIGVDVRYDAQGNKLGDNVLCEKPLFSWHWRLSRLLRRYLPERENLPIKPGVHYCFHLRVRPDLYELTVWEAGKKRPRPQCTASHPADLLPQGSVGVIAYHCGVRIYEYQVQPLPTPSDGS